MTDRAAAIKAFLNETPWANWTSSPIAADASARSYQRLTSPDGETVILMNAPPDTSEKTEPFARVGALLRDQNLCAPKTLLHDISAGLMVIDDLGTDDFAQWLRFHPDETEQLYDAACKVLIRLAKVPAPGDLTRMDPQTGADMVAITLEWYADNARPDALVATMRASLTALAPTADTLALRDFHAENLIWRPSLSGTDRVGLLDYQDAFVAPMGYDLASLLRDARRDIDPTLAGRLIADFACRTGQDENGFAAQFACLAVQRNLRILGVFARLIRRDGKLKYAAFVHRVWDHLQHDLTHPALQSLSDVVARTLPPPAESTLRGYL